MYSSSEFCYGKLRFAKNLLQHNVSGQFCWCFKVFPAWPQPEPQSVKEWEYKSIILLWDAYHIISVEGLLINKVNILLILLITVKSGYQLC